MSCSQSFAKVTCEKTKVDFSRGERALVEFVGLSRMDPKSSDTSTEWPGFKESHFFWSEAERQIQESTSANFLLLSMFEIVLSNITIIIIVCNY